MSEALKAFHKNVLKRDYSKYIDDYGYPPSGLCYKALAWRGLKEHHVHAYKGIDSQRIIQLEAEGLRMIFN